MPGPCWSVPKNPKFITLILPGWMHYKNVATCFNQSQRLYMYSVSFQRCTSYPAWIVGNHFWISYCTKQISFAFPSYIVMTQSRLIVKIIIEFCFYISRCRAENENCVRAITIRRKLEMTTWRDVDKFTNQASLVNPSRRVVWRLTNTDRSMEQIHQCFYASKTQLLRLVNKRLHAEKLMASVDLSFMFLQLQITQYSCFTARFLM